MDENCSRVSLPQSRRGMNVRRMLSTFAEFTDSCITSPSSSPVSRLPRPHFHTPPHLQVSELAERYAPSPAWFIRVVSEVFELGGEHTEPALAHSLLRLIAEQDTELHRGAVEVYLKLLDKSKLPELLLQVRRGAVGEGLTRGAAGN